MNTLGWMPLDPFQSVVVSAVWVWVPFRNFRVAATKWTRVYSVPKFPLPDSMFKEQWMEHTVQVNEGELKSVVMTFYFARIDVGNLDDSADQFGNFVGSASRFPVFS